MGIYRIMFIAGLSVAIVFLIVAVILFFVLKIPKAFGIATGRTQKKAMEQIRATGYESKVQRGGRKNREHIHAREAEMDNVEPEEGENPPEEGEAAAEAPAAGEGKPEAEGEKPEAAGEKEEKADESQDQAEKTDKPEEQDKADKTEKTDKKEKAEKKDKTDKKEKAEKKEKLRVRIRAGSDRKWNLENEETETLGAEEPGAIHSFASDPATEATDILTPENSLETGMEAFHPNHSGLTDMLTTEEGDVLKGDLPKPEDMEIVEGQQIIVLLSETIVHTEEELE